MKFCALCGKGLDVDKYFSRKSTCPNCGGDLHVCLNCRFYSETAHNSCLETKAEFQRSREKANFCGYFIFGDRKAPSREGATEDAKKKFDDLFRK